jgi:hypothetical protein
MAYFQLQPAELDLQQLADEYWQEAGERERELETAAYEAGVAIRNGEHTLANIETIVRWKSERMVHYLIGNGSENIRAALAAAASPDASPEEAVNALVALRGVDISIASAIMSAIFPERYAVLDYRALEALGHARPRRPLLYRIQRHAPPPGRVCHRQAANRPPRPHSPPRPRARALGVVTRPR